MPVLYHETVRLGNDDNRRISVTGEVRVLTEPGGPRIHVVRVDVYDIRSSSEYDVRREGNVEYFEGIDDAAAIRDGIRTFDATVAHWRNQGFTPEANR